MKFKKSNVIICIIIIVFLIAFDQGSKIIVDNFVEVPEDLDYNSEVVHIHPEINDEAAQNLTTLAEKLSVNVKVLLFIRALLLIAGEALLLLLTYGFYKLMRRYKEIKRYAKLSSAILCLAIATFVCSVFLDQLFWGGSLDWLCISWIIEKFSASGHYHPQRAHLILDLKDLYIFTVIPLYLLRVVLLLVPYFKLSKAQRKEIDYIIIHPIKSYKRYKKERLASK